MESFEERLRELNDLIKTSKNIVFFGGAGVSTESGIPDFRSKDGLYNTRDVQFEQYEPEYLLSNDCLYRDSKVFFEYYRQKMNVEGIKPNAAHKKLAEMEEKGKLLAVITQNIDGLHQKAGSEKVYELHGSVLRNYCMKCRKPYSLADIMAQEGVPRCPECGGMIKPDVVLYEEGLDDWQIRQSVKAISEADVLIVGGTSLNVYPAAGFINYYKGNKLVLINMSETPYDRHADLLIHDSIGKVLKYCVE